MPDLVGGLLPLATGIALSPVPLLALLVILLSARSVRAGTGFLIGWTLGIGAALWALTSASVAARVPSSSTSTTAATIEGLIGVVLIGLGLWRGWMAARRGPVERPRSWTKVLADLTLAKGLLVGVVMSLNPKGVAIAAGAGLLLSDPTRPAGEALAGATTYVLVASSSVAVLVASVLVTGGRFTSRLEAARSWLQMRQTLLSAVLLTALGLLLGVRGLLA